MQEEERKRNASKCEYENFIIPSSFSRNANNLCKGSCAFFLLFQQSKYAAPSFPLSVHPLFARSLSRSPYPDHHSLPQSDVSAPQEDVAGAYAASVLRVGGKLVHPLLLLLA